MRTFALIALLASCSGGTETTDQATDQQPAEAQTDAAADASKVAKRPEVKQIPAPPDVAAPPADAEKSASGLAWKVLTPGTGTEHPSPLGRVTVDFAAWTPDGKMLPESSLSRGRPATLGVTEPLIPPGLREGLTSMVQGEKRRFWVPESLGFGNQPGRPTGALVYEIELKNVQNPPPAPPDVAAPPADAKKTASGLAYKVLKPGIGDETPSPFARVVANYTGWTTDGQVFDSSVAKGKPTPVTLSKDAMPGWVEALTLMKRGEHMRVWIPESLVGKPELPKGMLVYDIELMTFDNPIPPPEDVGKPPADAKKTASGLAYKVLQKGKGDHPTDDAIMTVHFTGWSEDGSMDFSTVKRGKPIDVNFERVPLKGFAEALKLLSTGEKARFWIPQELAYEGRPGKPAGTMTFDIELLSWKQPPPPIPAPSDVAAPPADAQKTASGLAYKVLKKGSGTEKPGPTTRVQVHYTGWTTDGKMFDSSVQRGEPAVFPLNRVIAGWTEGLQLMTVGDQFRLWIPEELAYKGSPGKPAGMLVFDVELLDLVEAPAHPAGGPAMKRPPPKPE